jgi:hypothetical protein
MTEHEWQSCADLGRMLACLHDTLDDRKARLFLVACCRRVWPVFTDERSRRAVEAAEQFANGEIDAAALAEAHRSALEVPSFGTDWYRATAALHPANFRVSWTSVGLCCARLARAVAGDEAQWLSTAWQDRLREEYAAQCALLRDIAPCPFRPPPSLPPGWLDWEEGTIVKLARAIHDESAFERLPILADALEEAGCSDTGLLAHLRSPGPHVRGCFAVDLLTVREEWRA